MSFLTRSLRPLSTPTALLCLAIVSLSAGRLLAADSKPNIVILLADDLGWADVSMHGTEIQTPNIDRIATEGVELERFYVCPVCTPTRAGLMTGRYPIRYGLMRAVVPPWRIGGLDPEEVTIADVLATAGYENRGVFGKWHLGHSDIKYHPLRRGFTEFVGHYNGAIDYFTHEREEELDWHHGYESNYDEGYSTDLIADAAVDFIARSAPDGPFLCYVPFNAPHSPLQAKKRDLAAYQHLVPEDATRKPKKPGYGTSGRGKAPRQTLAAMISSMDQGIGRVLDALDTAGVADNTLVWFSSDNGGVGVGDNRPLRGAKASVFEGGIHVAAAMRWPDRVQGGRTISAPMAYIDVLPTVMRAVGVTDHGGKPLDGVDVLDVLTGEQAELRRDVYSYIGQQGENNEHITLIGPKWKLIVNGRMITDPSADPDSQEILLFDIVTDPYEKEDLASSQPEVVERMLKKLKEFRALQPANAVPPYGHRDGEFTAPKEWKIEGA